MDSDGEYSRDSSSDVSSDCEVERSLKSSTNWKRHYNANGSEHRLADLSLREKHNEILEGFSSDDSIASNSQACPLFEFFEQDPPYSRVPLADKVSYLSPRFLNHNHQLYNLEVEILLLKKLNKRRKIY